MSDIDESEEYSSKFDVSSREKYKINDKIEFENVLTNLLCSDTDDLGELKIWNFMSDNRNFGSDCFFDICTNYYFNELETNNVDSFCKIVQISMCDYKNTAYIIYLISQIIKRKYLSTIFEIATHTEKSIIKYMIERNTFAFLRLKNIYSIVKKLSRKIIMYPNLIDPPTVVQCLFAHLNPNDVSDILNLCIEHNYPITANNMYYILNNINASEHSTSIELILDKLLNINILPPPIYIYEQLIHDNWNILDKLQSYGINIRDSISIYLEKYKCNKQRDNNLEKINVTLDEYIFFKNQTKKLSESDNDSENDQSPIWDLGQ
jgi:hypothetical protein